MATLDQNYDSSPLRNNEHELIYNPAEDNQDKTQNQHSTSKNSYTLKQLMAGKNAHQFAQEFVHNIHMQRLADAQKPQSKFSEGNPHSKRAEALYKSASFNYRPDPENPDAKPSGPSVYTYLSNTIKNEIEKNNSKKNRDQIEGGMIHKLCKSMLSPESAKRIEEKANVLNYKNSQEGMCERLNKESQQWKEKHEEEKKKILQEELIECSFNPQINEASKLKAIKSPLEYYNYQLKWDEKVKEGIKNKQLEKEKNEVVSNPKPQISKKTKEFAQTTLEKKKLPKDVHQRLYEIKKDQQILEAKQKTDGDNPDFMLQGNPQKDNDDSGFFTNRIDQNPNELTFSPKISLKSKLLAAQKKEKLSKTINDSPGEKEKPHCTCYGCLNKAQNPGEESKCVNKMMTNFKLSGKSAVAFTHRFIREYKTTVQAILHQENPIKLHFIELEEILKRMGFLRSEPDKKETIGKETFKYANSQILKEIWQILKGQQKTWITSRNLLVFLLAVMNIKSDKELVPLIEDAELMKEEQNQVVEEPEDQKIKKQYGRYGFYGNLELNETDVQNIHRDYNILYLNKIAQKKEMDEIPDENIYSPQVTKYSSELAENQKKKLFEQFKESVPINLSSSSSKLDYYQLSNFRIAQKEKEIADLRNSYMGEQLEKCTFTPYVSDFKQAEKKLHLSSTFHSKDSGKFHGTSPLSIGKERFLDLYSLKKQQSDKKDKDFNIYEYEKQCDECTFKPDLEKSRLNNNIFSPKVIYSKGIEKNIERIQKGRIEKQLIENLKSKGLAPNEFRTSQILDEIKRMEETRSGKISGIYQGRSSNQTMSKNDSNLGDSANQYDGSHENPHNESGTSHGTKHYSTVIPEDGVPTFGLRNDDDDRIPLLFVDVNITEGRNARIVIYEGDKPEDLAEKFAEQYNLQSHMTEKLKELLELQINNLLHKIEEEEGFSESTSQRE